MFTFVFTPLLIVLFFAAGANCVLPQPAGVHLMPRNACCGQGFVFPQTTVTRELLPLFRDERWSELPTDSFLETYADLDQTKLMSGENPMVDLYENVKFLF